MSGGFWQHTWIHPVFGEVVLWFKWVRTPRGHRAVVHAVEWDLFTPESERAQLMAALVMEHPEWLGVDPGHEGVMDEDMQESDLPF